MFRDLRCSIFGRASDNEAMTEQHETFPSALQALLLIALLMGIEYFVLIVVVDTNLLPDVGFVDVSAFITVVGNGILFIGLMAHKRIGYEALFHPARSSVAATMTLVTAPILLLVPGLVLLAGWVNSVVVALAPMSDDDVDLFEAVMAPGVVSVVFACVGAPLLEEMLFRGVILRGFLRRYTRSFSILWSAALFAIAHLNLYQAATALALGIVAGWLYERCRSLWPCILLHAAYNSFVMYEYYLWSMEPEAVGFGTSAYSIGVSLAAAIVGGLMLRKLLSPAAPSVPSA
jgi:membrane protease YdiL (CAAX protease family)